MPINPFEHGAPWRPGPFTSNARSFAQWLARAGRASAAYIAGRMRDAYGIAAQVAGRIASAAVEYAQRLREFMFGSRDEKMPRGLIYRNPSIPDSYRVVATVRLRDGNAPKGSRDPRHTRHITVVIDLDHNPTVGEIRDIARRMARDEIIPMYSAGGEDEPDWNPTGVDIVTIERRT